MSWLDVVGVMIVAYFACVGSMVWHVVRAKTELPELACSKVDPLFVRVGELTALDGSSYLGASLPAPKVSGPLCSCCGASSEHTTVELIKLRVQGRNTMAALCPACISRGVVRFAENVSMCLMCCEPKRPSSQGRSVSDLDGGWY